MADRDSCLGRMVFPIHDERGELVAYAGRVMDGREPRYLFPPGFRKSQVVFNLHRTVKSAARQGGVAIVGEGFFDCLKVHQAGYGNVVALMGASVSDRQAEMLDTYFRELVVMLDGDEAGWRARRVLAAWWPAAYMAWVPAGWQPDQLSSEEIKGFCAGRTALPEHEDGMAVSIRLTRVPAGPCRNRPVRQRFSSRYTWTDCFKAGGLPKLNLP
jgi:DNA primase